MDITQYCHLANVRVLLALNHWLAGRASLYELALALATRWGDVAILAIMALLWFWPDPRPRDMLQPVTLSSSTTGASSGKARFRGSLRALWPRRQSRVETVISSTPPPVRLSRCESRAQALAVFIFALVVFLLVHAVAEIIGVDPPPFSYLPVGSALVSDAFAGVQRVGSMPAAHAAMLGALPVALWYWNRPLSAGWAVLAVLLAVAEVAVGLHYPADVLAGFLLGAAGMGGAMQLYDSRGRAYDWAAFAAGTFEPTNAPYCYFAYVFLFVFGLEFLQHFQHVVNFVDAFYAALHQPT